MHKYSLNPLDVTLQEFLLPFFEPEEEICLRVFSDRSDSAFSGMKLNCKSGEIQKMTDLLREHNARNRGIFFVVNFGGYDDAAIRRVNAQYVEMDDVPLEEQLARIQSFPLEPSLIIKTRKSLHCYWLVKDAAIDRFRHIQKRLVAQFSGDPACINESRVLRLPGFNHCKAGPVPVSCIKYNPEFRYTQQELEAHLPQIPDEETPPVAATPIKGSGTQRGLQIVRKRCPFIQYTKKNAESLPEPLWYAMVSNLALFEGGADAIHKLSKPYPNYNYNQT